MDPYDKIIELENEISYLKGQLEGYREIVDTLLSSGRKAPIQYVASKVKGVDWLEKKEITGEKK